MPGGSGKARISEGVGSTLDLVKKPILHGYTPPGIGKLPDCERSIAAWAISVQQNQRLFLAFLYEMIV